MRFQNIAEIENALGPGSDPSIRLLHEIWEQRQPVSASTEASSREVQLDDTRQIPWLQADPALAAAFLISALKNEEYLLVCDAFREATAFWNRGQDADAVQLASLCSSYASARTRLGQTGDAMRRLEPWSRDTRLSQTERGEILLQLGDILREEADAAAARTAQFQSGERALQYYQQALILRPDWIEARVRCAGMALRVSENLKARGVQAGKWAGEALSLIDEKENDGGPTFRLSLNKAVALATLGRVDEAARSYQRLKSLPGVSTRQLAEARYDSESLALALGKPRTYFKAAFPPLQLIVFEGHMPDLPGATSRFPPESILQVKRDLREKLQELEARVAIVSAAAGADLLFIEALQERPGANYHLILPWSREEFFRTSVEPHDVDTHQTMWGSLFERAMEKASTVRQLGQLYEPGDEAGWQYMQEVSGGLALLTARMSRLDVKPLALWDRKPARRAGGTASFVEFWTRYVGEPPSILDLPAVHGAESTALKPVYRRSERPTLHREVKTILFADVIGYSKLTEKVIQEFVEVFLDRLSKLVAESSYSPRCLNMWGDAIYAVFDYSQDAGRFAVQLTKMVHDGAEEWLRKGLYYEEADPGGDSIQKVPLDLRVGLHTGPVLAHYNPVVRQIAYTGSHVTRAARIQPVAARGEVYASEEFAAMVELDVRNRLEPTGGPTPTSPDGFGCEYAGTMSLAKNYPGRFRVYRVAARRDLPLEELAVAAHLLYCADRASGGATPGDPSTLPWAQLSEDLREANRAQVADIPYKLSLLGLELTPGHGADPQSLQFTQDQIETLARVEHDRWMMERQRMGWTYGRVRDNSRKLHPSLVTWDTLPETEKEKDREVIRNLPKLIAKAGFRVRRQL